jgi:deoxyribodipyrimidine photo-lyase
MIGEDYSTKLSPALAHGCISPRQIYHEIQRYEKERTANKSTYWVVFELIWRDYFKFFALKHGDRIFHEHGISGRGNARWRVDQELLTRWKQGRTGWPLVDANMRELAATGWMSNRGRQNVASFLALDLGLDWRLGADWFESLLSDYDPCSNWGNWYVGANKKTTGRSSTH